MIGLFFIFTVANAAPWKKVWTITNIQFVGLITLNKF